MADRGTRTPLLVPPVDGQASGSDNAGMQRFYARLRAVEMCARLNAAHEREAVSSDKGTGA